MNSPRFLGDVPGGCRESTDLSGVIIFENRQRVRWSTRYALCSLRLNSVATIQTRIIGAATK
jgi:hypothetical protein